MLLIEDFQLVSESMLEMINSLISSGALNLAQLMYSVKFPLTVFV